MLNKRLDPVFSDLAEDREDEDLTVLEITAGDGGNLELLQEYFQYVQM